MKTVIVLNKLEDIRELYDKRSANYSNRPDNYMARTLAGRNMRMLFMVGITFHLGWFSMFIGHRIMVPSYVEFGNCITAS